MVALKKSGHVLSYEALDSLCIKPKHWKDPLTDEPFTRQDVVVIQVALLFAPTAAG